jgi:hypothetical protein
VLHLDEHERLAAAVLDPVRHPKPDVDVVAPAHGHLHTVQRDGPLALDDEPVLRPVLVELVAEPLSCRTSIRFTLWVGSSARIR